MAKAKYVATCAASREAVWLRKLLDWIIQYCNEGDLYQGYGVEGRNEAPICGYR
jgi:hypothetical protein